MSSPSDPGWAPFGGGATLGEAGSEGGTIERDEEHPEGVRTTLERGGSIAPFAVTCGVYGWMVHTCYFSTPEEAEEAFREMQPELVALARAVPWADDPELERRRAELTERIAAFVERHP